VFRHAIRTIPSKREIGHADVALEGRMDPEASPNAQPPVLPGSPRTDAPPGAGHAGAVGPSVGQSSRRRFLRWLGGLTVVSTGGMILTPIVAFLIPNSSASGGNGGKVLVATTDDIPPGAGKVVAMGSKPAVVVNTDSGMKAYSAICTHLGCVVAWNDLQAAIVCPCHGGTFNPTNGAVVSGPPPTGLPALTVSVEGNQIFLSET
jgi:cytochrome b6-f complex iron-sulfur subunit